MNYNFSNIFIIFIFISIIFIIFSSNQIKIEDDTNNENVVMRNSTHSSDKLFNKRLTSNRFSLVFGDHFR